MANLVVDIGNTCVMQPTILPLSGGIIAGLSGVTIGSSVDLINADTFCQLMVYGAPTVNSGLVLQIQCADSDVSGSFTDPTSGLSTLPTAFSSGGLLWLNSGGTGGTLTSGGISGHSFLSGFLQFAGFQRPQRFARANFTNSGLNYFAGNLSVGFVSQRYVTGSGGGFWGTSGNLTVNV